MCGADIHCADQLCGSSKSETLWVCFWRAMQSLVLATMAEVISALSGNKRTPRKLDAGSRWARSWCDCAVVWQGGLWAACQSPRGAQGISRAQTRASISHWNAGPCLLGVWMASLCQAAVCHRLCPTHTRYSFCLNFPSVVLGHTALWKLLWKQVLNFLLILNIPLQQFLWIWATLISIWCRTGSVLSSAPYMSPRVSHRGVPSCHSVQLKRFTLTELLWVYFTSKQPAAKTVSGIIS